MGYNELLDAFRERTRKYKGNGKIADYCARLESNYHGFGWPAIYASYAIKRVVDMTDKELLSHFTALGLL